MRDVAAATAGAITLVAAAARCASNESRPMPKSGRARTAEVLVLTQDATLYTSIRCILEDELTRINDADARLCKRRGSLGIPDVPDIVVFDARLGSDVARAVCTFRRQWPTAGLMVVNAKDQRAVNGWLDIGADDACHVGDSAFASRLHAIARRARAINSDSRIAVGDLVVDRERRRVWCAGRILTLSVREFDILYCLFQHSPNVVTRDLLTGFAWGGTATPSNALEVHISYLRRKTVGSQEVGIRTVRGVGYVLAPICAQPSKTQATDIADQSVSANGRA